MHLLCSNCDIDMKDVQVLFGPIAMRIPMDLSPPIGCIMKVKWTNSFKNFGPLCRLFYCYPNTESNIVGRTIKLVDSRVQCQSAE